MTATTGTKSILTHNIDGLPWCTEGYCRAKWTHAHGVKPGYPTVVGLAYTEEQKADYLDRGFELWAPNF